jgi:hypothetical protein
MDAAAKRAIPTLIKGMLFAAPLLIAGVAMEKGLAKVVNSYNTTRAKTEATASTCEVLILGSSNAAWGIAPDAFSVPALNLANAAQSLYYDLTLAERYVPRMPRLKVVILGLTYVTLKSEVYDWDDSDRAYYYAHFWDLPPQGQSFFETRRWSLTALYGVRMSASYARKGFHVANIHTLDGPGAAAQTPAQRQEEADKRADELTRVLHDERLTDNLARLDRLASLVEQHGATLVLAELPVQESLLQRLSPTEVAATARARAELMKRYPGIRYVDHSRDSSFALADFYDTDHLNPQGATKLTKLLEGELLHPKVAQPEKPGE